MYTTYYPPVTAVPTTFWVPRNIAIVTVLSIVGLICFACAVIGCATGRWDVACFCCLLGIEACAAARSAYNPEKDQSMNEVGQNQEDMGGENNNLDQKPQLNSSIEFKDTGDNQSKSLDVNK